VQLAASGTPALAASDFTEAGNIVENTRMTFDRFFNGKRVP
jgi:hypothetical protein